MLRDHWQADATMIANLQAGLNRARELRNRYAELEKRNRAEKQSKPRGFIGPIEIRLPMVFDESQNFFVGLGESDEAEIR